MEKHQKKLTQIIDEKSKKLIEVSNCIWEFAELGFLENKSAALICDVLEKEGFHVQKGVGGINTAFIGSFGDGHPVVAILGEYDALSGLSQKPNTSKQEPLVEGESGHGCGHNLLGTGALAAAIALRHYMEKNDIKGTVRYYGCPAEETGAGKTYMVREGLFNDVDLALTWHPGTRNQIWTTSSLANIGGRFTFKGISSHAAASPHLGRSALDAVELMNLGVNYLREHAIPEARIHYAITNTGGISPNVVQSEAEVHYYVRAPKLPEARDLFNRVAKIAKGAALMTETTVEIPPTSGVSNVIPNNVLSKVMHKNFQALGAPQFNEEDQQFAKAIQATYTEADLEHDTKDFKELQGKVLADFVEPLKLTDECMPGSTDVGDVSWVVPTVQCKTATWALGTPGHSWQVVSMGKSTFAQKAMLHAGKVIAATALETMKNPQIIEEAKKELKERLGEEKYVSPISEGVNRFKEIQENQ